MDASRHLGCEDEPPIAGRPAPSEGLFHGGRGSGGLWYMRYPRFEFEIMQSQAHKRARTASPPPSPTASPTPEDLKVRRVLGGGGGAGARGVWLRWLVACGWLA